MKKLAIANFTIITASLLSTSITWACQYACQNIVRDRLGGTYTNHQYFNASSLKEAYDLNHKWWEQDAQNRTKGSCFLYPANQPQYCK